MTRGRLGQRAVEESDRWRLLDWRNQERVREFSADSDRISRDDHDRWFDRLVAERTDRFLIATIGERPIGVVQLVDLEPDDGRCSWGCHLGETDVPPGTGACLPVLGLGLGFGRFSMRRMTAQVLATNKNMRGIHRRLGVTEEGVLREELRRPNGEVVDVHQYGVLAHEWATIRGRAEQLLPRPVRDELSGILDELRPSTADR